jgi:hypothetical protein
MTRGVDIYNNGVDFKEEDLPLYRSLMALELVERRLMPR